MRMMLAASALILTTLTGAADQTKTPKPEATPAGDPVNCLRLTDIRETKVRDGQTIDFYTRGGKVYRNTLDYSCPGLASEQRFIHKTSIPELCSLDTITVLYTQGMGPGASCGLGKFQPVTLAKK